MDSSSGQIFKQDDVETPEAASYGVKPLVYQDQYCLLCLAQLSRHSDITFLILSSWKCCGSNLGPSEC